MERPAIGRPVAEEADRDLIGLALHGAQRGARDQTETARDDAVRAQHPDREVGDVHRSALALADPRGAREQLGDHPAHRRSLGQRVAVAAVGRGDRVVGAQVGAGSRRDGFLTDRKVGETGDVTGEEVLLDPLLEHADANHRAQQREAEVAAPGDGGGRAR